MGCEKILRNTLGPDIDPLSGDRGYAQFLLENNAAMLKRKEQWKAELAMACDRQGLPIVLITPFNALQSTHSIVSNVHFCFFII